MTPPAFATAAPRPGPSFCRMGGVLGGGRIDQDGGRKRLNEREEVVGGQHPPNISKVN